MRFPIVLLVIVFAIGCGGTLARVCSPQNYEQFAGAYVCPATPKLDPATDAALIEAACEHATRAAYHIRAAACVGTGTSDPGTFAL